MAYRGFGRTGQQFEELLLIVGFNGEDVDQRDKFAAQRDRCHRRIRTMWLLQGQPLSDVSSHKTCCDYSSTAWSILSHPAAPLSSLSWHQPAFTSGPCPYVIVPAAATEIAPDTIPAPPQKAMGQCTRPP